MAHSFQITHLHRTFTVALGDDGALELWLDGCLRKRRAAGGQPVQYVWTDIELDWEEHHLVEARYRSDTGELFVAINGEPVLARCLPAGPLAASRQHRSPRGR